MEATDAAPIRTAEGAQSEYPTPPDLHITAWSNLKVASAVVAPHLIAKLDDPAQRTSAAPASSSSDGTPRPCQDFYRRAFWAPDGSAILAITESQQKHVFASSPSGKVERTVELRSPTPLLDAIWYLMPATAQPDEQREGSPMTATWCFAESHRDLPVRLTASNDGRSRASYSIMNHVEKFVGPHSLAFSPDLSRLYCGLYSALAVFPLSRPGLNTHAHVPLIPGKRSIDGQRGIVSALAVTTHPSYPGHDLVAVGTFSGTIGIYSFDPAMFPEPTEHTATHAEATATEEPLAQSACLAGWREIEGDGVTQLKFHPLTPYVLFVTSRRSNYIYVYDIRYLMGDTSRWSFRPLRQAAVDVRTGHLLAKLPRTGVGSHQRLYFDVDWAGRWLASGDVAGNVHLWRIDTGRFTDQTEPDAEASSEGGSLDRVPDLTWHAHQGGLGFVMNEAI